MKAVPQVRLTGRAQRFLQMLQEFGHLDEEGVGDLLMSLRVSHPSRGVALADLDAVRMAAAVVMFARSDPEAPDPMMAEDWPLLFS